MLPLFTQAWNSWRSAKGVALLAVLALAIGIGSATAIYTVVHAVLLKPLPYRDGGRFVALYGALFSEPDKKSDLPYEYLVEYEQRQHSFDVFGWFTFADFNLTQAGQPLHINGVRVTPSLADGLGVNLQMGRWFRTQAQEAGNDHLAVISYSLWRRMGGGDVLGKTISLDGQGYTVTGVAPSWFELPYAQVGGQNFHSDVWIPVDERLAREIHRTFNYFAYGRRRPGVSFEQATADMKRIAAQLAREHPENHGQNTAKVEGLQQTLSSEIRKPLLLLFAAAGLLLLITCANVSGLLVTRAVTRARETAIRLALGAAQRQLMLQYFSEGLLVSVAGAALGVAMSYALVRLIVGFVGDYIPRANELGVEWTALLFAIGAALATGLLTSLAPLWQALKSSPNEALTDGVRASAGQQSRRLSQALVITEIAIAFTLLATGALLVSQLSELNRVRPGFDLQNLLTFRLTATDSAFPDTQKLAAYQKQLRQAFDAIPGVESAAFVNQLPLNGCCIGTALFAEGRPVPKNVTSFVSLSLTSQDYAKTMRIPLQAGRELTDRDTGEHPLLAVINRAAAMYHWQTPNPVGEYGHFLSPNGDRFQVIGVVGDVKNDGLATPARPEVYLSTSLVRTNPVFFVVRSTLPEGTLISQIRQAIHRINPAQPIYQIQSMSGIARDSLTLERATSLLTTFFAGAALLLAALGVYGVVAYSVRQRTVEFGTRMALGAVGRDLLHLVMSSGLKMATGGLLLGAVAIYATTTLLLKSAVIHSVEPLPFAYSTAAIAAIAILASFYPAWRASQLSPMVAIRDQPETIWLRTKEHLQRVAAEVSGLLGPGQKAEEISESALLSGFVEATRQAESPDKAMQAALSLLCDALGAESALLLEKGSESGFRCVAAVPIGTAVPDFNSDNGFLMRRLQSYSLPLPLAEADYESWLRWAAEQRPSYTAELQWLRQAKVRLAVALRTTKEAIGLLLLGTSARGESYSPAAKRALRVCADQLALMLENGRLTGRVVEQEKLRRDLALAIEVQKRLLPEAYPESSFGDVAAFTLPARSVGGDYYDFIKVGEHGLGIALADVAGKGIAAALIMSVVQASLRILSAEGNVSLPDLVSKMNRFLHRSTGFNSYATFFYAQVDEQTGQLSYVNAGHNPPYLLRAADVEELTTGGMVIGMFAQASYEEAKVDLKSGDVLVAFTDGVTEALDARDEEFGEERLKELLLSVAHLPVGEMSRRIAEALRGWIGNAPQHDDLTFLVLKVK